MTLQIFKSVIDGLPYNHAEEVEKHRQALLAHRFTGDAAPTAPALIEQAVRRVQSEGEADDFVADYVVVDDAPPEPVPTDEQRKQMLIGGVRQAEREASDAVIGPGKLRLLNFEAGLVFGKADDQRTDADLATLDSHRTVQARLAAIQYHAAKLEAQIDDLTPDRYDDWTLTWNPD